MSLSQPVGLTASRNVEFLDIQSGALMPLYIKDMTTAALVTLLTELRGLTKHDAVRFDMRAGLDRAHEVIPLREREPAAALRAPPTPRPWHQELISSPMTFSETAMSKSTLLERRVFQVSPSPVRASPS